ncbi:MAG: hypothetical protein PHY14_03045 [Candidatus Gracilibacteria bacterium]|nr:hypothetical protein [Candidatus Gracilibacteria bacterium]
MSDEKLTGVDIAQLFDELKDDVGALLLFLQDKSIDDARKRALWIIAGYYDEAKWMTVPKEFLPHFECQRREKERTKAYAFSQAYLLSKKIAKEYLDTNNLQEFYREIPNLLIACMQLHQLGVFPRDIGSGSTCATLLEEALSFAELLQDGIKDFYIQKTPEIRNLLDQVQVRRVV